MSQIDLELLKKILEINSYSTNKNEVNEKIDLVLKQLENLELKVTMTPSETYGDFTVIETKEIASEKPLIGLVSHIDTVHLPEKEFPIVEKDGKLFGPGAQDMQASIFVMIELFKKLAAENKLKNLVAIINTCEEKGSPEFQDQLKEISERLDYVMVFESGNGSDDMGNFDFSLADSRKGIFQQKISTKGPGGHSGDLSTKEERKNAISHAIQMMKDIEDLQDFEKETTVNLAAITGGQENTTIAENARFVFDVRFRYESEGERVKASIAEILKKEYVPGVEVTDEGYNYDLPSLQPNDNSEEFFYLVSEAADREGIKVKKEPRGGWSDACNIYTYNQDLKILDGFGPTGGGEHSVNEFVDLESIPKSIQLVEAIILQLLS